MRTDALPAAPNGSIATSEALKRWAAYHVAAGAIKSYTYDVTRYVLTVPVDTGQGVEEVSLTAKDFIDVFRAPLGRWFVGPEGQ